MSVNETHGMFRGQQDNHQPTELWVTERFMDRLHARAAPGLSDGNTNSILGSGLWMTEAASCLMMPVLMAK
jgi:hypothetical protein